MPLTRDPAVQLLLDRAEIHDAQMRYATGVDSRNYDQICACFAPDFHAKYGPRDFTDADQLITFISGVEGNHTTTHFMANQYIDVDGDQATMETYAMLTHHKTVDGKESEMNVPRARYIHKLARQDGRWLIYDRGGDPVWAPHGVTRVNTDDPAVQWLLDRAEIHDLAMRYSAGLDLRDYDMMRSCFAPEFEATFGARYSFSKIDDFIAFIRDTRPRFTATNHSLGNQLIEVHGDRANMETYIMVTHFEAREGQADHVSTKGGPRYLDKLVREDGRWLISQRREVGGNATEPDRVGRAPALPESQDPAAQYLLDRAEIEDLTVRYTLGVDRRDYDLIRSCFAPDFHARYHDRSFTDLGSLVEYIKGVERWHSTTHFLGNQLIHVHGDEADVDTYAFIMHRETESGPVSDWSKGAARYIDKVVRKDGRWLIRERTHGPQPRTN